MDIVTVVNRTDEEVRWMFDGREYILPPLDKKALPADVAAHGYNKTKFALHMELGTWQRAIGVVEWGHDVEPLDSRPSDFTEIFDRDTDPEGAKVREHKFGNLDLASRAAIDSAL